MDMLKLVARDQIPGRYEEEGRVDAFDFVD